VSVRVRVDRLELFKYESRLRKRMEKKQK
jgi:hypothetical protein